MTPGKGKGFFITLEGGDGAGKTTQIKRLADSLSAKGYDVITTREPGGTPEAEKIRALLVNRDGGNWTPMVEAILLYAARLQHVEQLIAPAIAAGKVVISDRFADSTRAYQSYGRGLALDRIEGLNDFVLQGFKPDLTFVLDMEVEDGLARSRKRLNDAASTEDRFEGLDIAFHQRLRMGYLEIASREPDRCVIVNANRAMDDIAADLEKIALEKMRA